ncbi:TPA: hypothetical protein NHI63_002538 [Legionella pneumophila]|uniref:Uncharacterized protein n=2 Tax=Legionella TaxID=445 RepID=A0A378PHZ2_9GAMM|nr:MULTISPECIES: hypothetical protein [Legionella]KTD70551.1 hypothetical protein Lstg_3036 [Legionella steigerwaltii]MCZ4692064.1 hypothetical protein [Legionella pneumophila]MCZ4709355.1 hypothetical protein [Legionella pneumophila]MCZ4719583.1 hypothetical protein [Legionella pneumophila]WBA07466.1 hypothetical protein LpnH3D14_03301 [Legionella pneumophila]
MAIRLTPFNFLFLSIESLSVMLNAKDGNSNNTPCCFLVVGKDKNNHFEGMIMNAKDCFTENDYEEKTKETSPLFDEKEGHEARDLENEMNLDEEFDAIRSMN